MVASAQEDPTGSGLPRIMLEQKQAEMEARRVAEQEMRVRVVAVCVSVCARVVCVYVCVCVSEQGVCVCSTKGWCAQ